MVVFKNLDSIFYNMLLNRISEFGVFYISEPLMELHPAIMTNSEKQKPQTEKMIESIILPPGLFPILHPKLIPQIKPHMNGEKTTS